MAEKEKVAANVYGSVDEMMADGASEVEYAVIEGFKPGKTIRIGSVSASEWIEWTESNEGPEKKVAGLRLITRSLVGPEPANARISGDKDIPALGKMRHSITERILREIVKLNGISVRKDGTTDAENKAKKD